MKKRILVVLLVVIGFASLAVSQTTEAWASKVKVEILDIPSLPVRITEANFNNLEHRSDLDYSIANLTDDEIWNYEFVAYFFDSNGVTITKKLEICLDDVIEASDERCRYVPPGTLIAPRKTEDVGVVIDERVEPGTKVVLALTEVRGAKGIWNVDEAKLRSAIQNYAKGRPNRPLGVKKTDHIRLSNADRLAVIEPSLRKALLDKQIPDYGLIKDKKNVVLSTENIPSAYVPRLPGINLILLSPAKIQEKADREGDFVFLSFVNIAANGNKIMVVLTNTWVKSKNSTKRYLSGGGVFLEYHKANGKWVGKPVGGWIS
ncbi:MAG TPA: hypothetical protein PLL77_04950 [Pyrinomonadaceae bacterium]|nr:hypothetical protein [Pyrinomonadaceae bacterium]